MRPLTLTTEARAVTPSGNPLGGGQRRHVVSEVIVTNTAAAAGSASFDVNIPSNRLSVGVAFTYAPTSQEDATFPTGATAWQAQLVAWVNLSNEKGGRMTRANVVMPATPVPTMWEVESTTVRKWRGTVTIPSGSGVIPGVLYATAFFEPAPGESTMPDDELQALFGACSITGVVGAQI